MASLNQNYLLSFEGNTRGGRSTHLVEQLGNDGARQPPLAQGCLGGSTRRPEGQRREVNRKSKTLIDLVNARNGELAGDGTAAVRRLISRQFQDTCNVALASLQRQYGRT